MINHEFTALEKVQLHPFIKRIWRISFSILVLMIIFLFLPWQQTVKGIGSVMALNPTERPYSILANIDGFVDKYYVEENQHVKKGDLLFSMLDLDKGYADKLNAIKEDLQNRQKNITEQISLSKTRIENAKEYLSIGLNVYTQKFNQINNKIKSLKIKKVSLIKQHDIEKLNFQRIEVLYKDGIESKRKYDSLESTYILAKAKSEKIDIDIDIENNNIEILKKEKNKFLKENQNKIKSLEKLILSSKNNITSLNQDIQKQSVLISRYARSNVYAQKDGFVVRLYQNDKNKLIKKGDKVLYFSPDVSQKAILLKSSDFNMPLIKKGLQSRIVFYGWPAMQISGWPMIKHGTFGGVIKKVDSISHDKGFYYSYIVEDSDEPWPKGNVLKIGTQATVWIRLETVPIWYQLWRIVNGLPPRMVATKIEEK